jgi:hypothetical protein
MPAIKKCYKHIPIEILIVFVIASPLTNHDLRSVVVDVIAAVTFRWLWFHLLLIELEEGGVILFDWLLAGGG